MILKHRFDRLHLSKKIGKLSFHPFLQLVFDSFSLEYEKTQHEDQLNKVNILINYFREKLTEHGLNHEPPRKSELTSPLYHPITPYEEQTILSSYMKEHENDNDDDHVSTTKITMNEPVNAIAMKLPRNFAPLNLNLTTTNEIIHSPYFDGNEIEYKKEFSSDILDKYGGQQKKSKQQQQFSGKKHKRNKKVKQSLKNQFLIFFLFLLDFWYHT
jgi:hypothetical protein